ncbi:hypothetical protein ACS0TY_014660 [Phlomoides rotata]
MRGEVASSAIQLIRRGIAAKFSHELDSKEAVFAIRGRESLWRAEGFTLEHI